MKSSNVAQGEEGGRNDFTRRIQKMKRRTKEEAEWLALVYLYLQLQGDRRSTQPRGHAGLLSVQQRYPATHRRCVDTAESPFSRPLGWQCGPLPERAPEAASDRAGPRMRTQSYTTIPLIAMLVFLFPLDYVYSTSVLSWAPTCFISTFSFLLWVHSGARRHAVLYTFQDQFSE